MKTRILLLIILLLTSMTGFCETVTITTTVENEFSPNDVTITSADIVHFVMGSSIHNAVEVSQATWESGGTTPLLGGFSVDFGQTKDISGLSVGTHYFVCQNHSFMGMRGKIEVNSLGLNDFTLSENFKLYPNPTSGLFTVKADDHVLGTSYLITDEIGRQILQGEFDEISTTIDISFLKSGIYFLKVGDMKRQTFKLIKK